MKISEYLKQYRKNNNLTQQDLADKLFVSKQAISKWENDRGLPDINTYPLISEVLGVSIDELMGKDIKKNEIIDEKKETSKKYPIIIVLIILLIPFILFISLYDREKVFLKKLEDKTEEILDLDLPQIIQYEYIDTSSFNDTDIWYPLNIYYFMFEENNKLLILEESINKENDWNMEVNDNLKNNLPLILQSYCNNQNYIKIINQNKEIVSNLPDEKGTYEFTLLCYQEKLNRLVVSTFIYEVK